MQLLAHLVDEVRASLFVHLVRDLLEKIVSERILTAAGKPTVWDTKKGRGETGIGDVKGAKLAKKAKRRNENAKKKKVHA